MDMKLREMSLEEFKRWPRSQGPVPLGEEVIRLHCWNHKKMNWYLTEYDIINRRFYGFFESRSEGISSGAYPLEELLSYGRRGEPWEVMVDEGWMPVKAKEIEALKGYISMMTTLPDLM
jgi:hypothetical protein